jgi:hypothetical protein
MQYHAYANKFSKLKSCEKLFSPLKSLVVYMVRFIVFIGLEIFKLHLKVRKYLSIQFSSLDIHQARIQGWLI